MDKVIFLDLEENLAELNDYLSKLGYFV